MLLLGNRHQDPIKGGIGFIDLPAFASDATPT
jgi:hypothetical protein